MRNSLLTFTCRSVIYKEVIGYQGGTKAEGHALACSCVILVK
jgi:hypothetical protein